MRWLLLLLVLLLSACGSENDRPAPTARAELRGDSELVQQFRDAERETGVPAAVLATVAYLETRLETRQHAPSPGHAAPAYGIMGIGSGGLVNLEEAAARAGVSASECSTETRANIRAAALWLADRRHGAPAERDADWQDAIAGYGGDVIAASAVRLLASGWRSSDDAGLSIEVRGNGESQGIATIQLGLGFPGAIWSPAVGYTNANRGPGQINFVVIHTTQGSYGGTISWFKNPAAQASSHYVVRSSDGEITQMVDDADIAWHDACFNSESIGIEHEGFVDAPGTWYTEAMYGASAKLTAWLCDAYGIPKDHGHIMGHSETPDCSDHTDPGPGWNWDHYLGLVQSGGVTSQNCTAAEAAGCGNYGCYCVDHQCNGGFCDGTGCGQKSKSDCGAYGCGCVDGQCSGVFCPGTGCTAKETNDCAAYGCQCVDHKCSGGFCDGSGCTAKQTNDCGAYGCGCVDGQCNGVVCAGTGCTAKQTLTCEDEGKTCKNGKCEGGSDAGKNGEAGAGAGGGPSEEKDAGSATAGGSGGKKNHADAGLATLPGKPDTDAVDGSCGCRLGGRSPSGAFFLFALGAVLAAMRRRAGLLALGLVGCGAPDPGESCDLPRSDPSLAETSEELSSIDCNEHGDTGYTQGNAFPITVVTVDGKPVEKDTANAYYVMAQAAANEGVNITIVSGFRTMGEQQYLYNCYVTCSCNSCNLAAKPGYSNHQSGHALDLNTSSGSVLNWLNAHGAAYGFSRTVPSELWHWEWWGGGPGGGPCGLTPQNCTTGEAAGCANYGCACVDHQCNGGFCDGTGCTQKSKDDCGAFGCGCVDGQCNGVYCPGTGCTAKETNDCGAFGCNCVDHKCSGGFCDGSGCTALDEKNCSAFGCGCVDHACSGFACEGTACTAKQALKCEETGQTCSFGKCEGEASSGTETGGSGGKATGGAPSTGVDGGHGGGEGGWSGGKIGTADGDGGPLAAKADNETVEGSCACRAASPVRRSPWALVFLAALGVAVRRRRR